MTGLVPETMDFYRKCLYSLINLFFEKIVAITILNISKNYTSIIPKHAGTGPEWYLHVKQYFVSALWSPL